MGELSGWGLSQPPLWKLWVRQLGFETKKKNGKIQKSSKPPIRQANHAGGLCTGYTPSNWISPADEIMWIWAHIHAGWNGTFSSFTVPQQYVRIGGLLAQPPASQLGPFSPRARFIYGDGKHKHLRNHQRKWRDGPSHPIGPGYFLNMLPGRFGFTQQFSVHHTLLFEWTNKRTWKNMFGNHAPNMRIKARLHSFSTLQVWSAMRTQLLFENIQGFYPAYLHLTTGKCCLLSLSVQMFGQFPHLVGLTLKTEQKIWILRTQQIMTEIDAMKWIILQMITWRKQSITTRQSQWGLATSSNNRTAPWLKLIYPVPTLHYLVEILEDYMYHNSLSLAGNPWCLHFWMKLNSSQIHHHPYQLIFFNV